MTISENEKSKRPNMSLAEINTPCRFWQPEDKRKQ